MKHPILSRLVLGFALLSALLSVGLKTTDAEAQGWSGRNRSGFSQSGYDRSGSREAGFDRAGSRQPGFAQRGEFRREGGRQEMRQEMRQDMRRERFDRRPVMQPVAPRFGNERARHGRW